jgi:FMN phosphatase YigB (HAD superfamily)
MSKLLLTDIDEVVLDWRSGFAAWCRNHPEISKSITVPFIHAKAEDWLNLSSSEVSEYIGDFHNSIEFEKLVPYREALKYIPMLAELGYKFVAITAIENNTNVINARVKNLQEYFPGIFSAVHCVGLMADKEEVLSWYKPTYWVEDKPYNAEVGFKHGHTSLLINTLQNYHYSDPNITKVSGWAEIYNMLNI